MVQIQLKQDIWINLKVIFLNFILLKNSSLVPNENGAKNEIEMANQPIGKRSKFSPSPT